MRVKSSARPVEVGNVIIGGGNPIAVQSMCATKTQNVEATLNQIKLLESHGADLIRIAIDSKRDVEALRVIRSKTKANLVVDLQENYRLVELVAPLVQKIRYNPGHLHHHEKNTPVPDKVKFIVNHARNSGCAIRIGVNFGSLDPALETKDTDQIQAALQSATYHIEQLEELGFDSYVVSLKSSDPNDVVEINKKFKELFPEVPIHLGVTEAGMLPMGEIKTRVAFENLLCLGIGDTVRVSLTLPYSEKHQEVLIGRKIVEDVEQGRFRSVPRFKNEGLNIISCPSCSRVENEAFVELAQKVKEVTSSLAKENLTIAVMGCRVNGPGETDDADLGLWCAPNHVNLKRKGEFVGAFSYDEILVRLQIELDQLITYKHQANSN